MSHRNAKNGIYLVQKLLGQGGLGRVFAAQSPQGKIALKFLKQGLPHQALDFFREEVRLQSRLANPHLVRIYDFYDADLGWPLLKWDPTLEEHFKQPAPFFAMEYVEGRSLEDVSTQEAKSFALEWFHQAVQGLHYLHSRGIIHRDIKPSNILLSSENSVKILDFSLSLENSQLPLSGETVGTLAFMPPEAFLGSYDIRGDLFSLGAVFYKIITGQLPFPRPLTPSGLEKTEKPRGLSNFKSFFPDFFPTLLEKLLELSPAARPHSTQVILRYLSQHSDAAFAPVSEADAGANLEKVHWVGRPLELSALEHSMASARKNSSPQGIVLQGPTGIGRSRLLEEWKWKAMLQGCRFWGISPEMGSNWPSMFAPESEKRNFFAITQTALNQLRDKPGVIAFTDLHQWEPAARQKVGVFSSLALQSQAPIVLIWEFNTDLPVEDFNPDSIAKIFEASSTVSLHDFTESEAEAFLEAAGCGVTLSSKLKTKVFAACGGMPLLLIEALRSIESKGKISTEDIDFQPPTTLQEAKRQRVSELSDLGRRLLGLILTHPVPSTAHEFEAVFPDPESMTAALLELDLKDFLRARSAEAPQLQLPHPSLHATLLAALPPELRLACHRTWLKFLADRVDPKSPDPELLLQLVEHALEAEEIEPVVQWGTQALQVLDRRGHFAQLVDWGQKMLAIQEPRIDRIWIHALCAPAYYRLGRFDSSRRAYADWYVLRQASDDNTHIIKVRLHYYLGLVSFAEGNWEDARLQLEHSLAAGDAQQHEVLRPFHSRVLNLLGVLEERAGKLSEAEKFFRQAAALGEGTPPLVAESEQRLGIISQKRLRYSEARKHLERTLEVYRSTEDKQSQAMGLQSLGLLDLEQGRLAAARNTLEASVELARSGGEILQWGRYLGNLSLAYMNQADYGAATETLEAGQRILDFAGREPDRLLQQIQAASLATRLGNRERFMALTQSLKANNAVLKQAGLDGHFGLLLAENAYRNQDYAEAHRRYSLYLEGPKGKVVGTERGNAVVGMLLNLHASQALDPASSWIPSEVDALRNSPNPLLAFWGRTFSIFLSSTKDIPEDELTKWRQSMESIEAPESRIEALQAAARHWMRQRSDSLAHSLRESALEEWKKIYNRLPEELKMDYEKNRPLPIITRTPEEGTKVSKTRFRQFCEINQQISRKTDIPEILARVMDAAIELTGAERGFLLLKNDAVKKGPFVGFEIRIARGMNQRSLQEGEFQFSFSAVKQAVSQGGPLLTDNAQQDTRFQAMQSVMQFQLKSMLVVPLELEGQVLGAIYLDHRYQPDCFTEEDVMLLAGFASQAALAIQKAEWLADLKTKVADQSHQIEALSKELTQARSGLKYEYPDIIGKSPAMMAVFKLLDHVSKTRIPVWIYGESGTGKEMIARSLHLNSPRKEGPFVSENCSAIPENLLESELFGFKKAAFTHADRDRIGLFELANGGTLFLDEVADMPMAMQVKLLRVLQEGEVRPLGSNKKVRIDVRLVTASNQDLQRLVKEGKFRQDLFFRINGLTIPLPPLRRRREDIPLLVHHFLKKISREYDLKPAGIAKDALEYLVKQPWTGNIRELEGVVRNALLFAEGRPITRKILNSYQLLVAPDETAPTLEAIQEPRPAEYLSEEQSREKHELIEAMVKHRADKALVASELGISLKSVYARMKRYGIPKKQGPLEHFLKDFKAP